MSCIQSTGSDMVWSYYYFKSCIHPTSGNGCGLTTISSYVFKLTGDNMILSDYYFMLCSHSTGDDMV